MSPRKSASGTSASAPKRRPPKTDFLIVPGIGDSGADHWQSRWEYELNGAVRIIQRDWHTPHLAVWATAIEAVLRRVERPPVVIAHSFGCLAAVLAAARQPRAVAGLFLAAPADPGRVGGCDALPRRRLPMPSRLFASANDPWLSLTTARELADHWGSNFSNAGRVGHLNPASGFGEWPDGWAALQRFTHRSRADAQRLASTP